MLFIFYFIGFGLTFVIIKACRILFNATYLSYELNYISYKESTILNFMISFFVYNAKMVCKDLASFQQSFRF